MRNRFDFTEKLVEDEDVIHFLYGFRNYFSPLKLMRKLFKLSKNQNEENKKRYGNDNQKNVKRGNFFFFPSHKIVGHLNNDI